MFVVAALVLAACGGVPGFDQSTQTPAAPAEATDIVSTPSTGPTQTATQAATPKVLATESVEATKAVKAEACSLTDGTAQVQITQSQDGTEWLVNPKALKVVAGYASQNQPGHDASKLGGCDMWAEYESPDSKEHVIVVLRDDPTKGLSHLGADGLFHIPTPKGGSFWVGPALWNTADLSTEKPSLALEMAAEKRVNQLRNGYNWPIVLHLPDSKIVTYGTEHKFGQFYSGCTDLKQPEAVNVAGTILGTDQYYASIGIEGCMVAVKIDGTWQYWENAKDNVLYSTAEAWLFPKSYTPEQVQAWIENQ